MVCTAQCQNILYLFSLDKQWWYVQITTPPELITLTSGKNIFGLHFQRLHLNIKYLLKKLIKSGDGLSQLTIWVSVLIAADEFFLLSFKFRWKQHFVFYYKSCFSSYLLSKENSNKQIRENEPGDNSRLCSVTSIRKCV